MSLAKKCLKCGQARALTKHHVFPQRYFPRDPRPLLIYICRKPCHDELESLIPKEECTKDEYLRITYDFIGEKFLQIVKVYDFSLFISLFS
jgi:hypothetical protein